MSEKSNKIELSGEFMAIWREQTFWDVISPMCRGKNKKEKSLKRMSGKFQISSD